MQEALKKDKIAVVEHVERSVTLSLKSKQICLQGTWSWDMQSDAVYCSDVMSFPEDFIGTKCIVHPDDLGKVAAAASLIEDKDLSYLDFRIITTYGEVKTISGHRVSMRRMVRETEPVPGKERWQEMLEQIAAQKENDFLQIRGQLTEYTERLHGIGSWLLNKQSGEAWYSDNVFRIYNLAPQSLNANANTFHQFIHKEDRIAVVDALEKAFDQQAPLHIEFRIVTADGETKYVQLITRWFYNAIGQEVLSGVTRDVTEERELLDEVSAAQSNTFLHKQILGLSEQKANMAYWLTNLVTRKTEYSDNYYRIYGFKQVSLPNYNSFVNFVHVDDRQGVKDLVDKMFNEHVLPETEFRIVRPDGKTRYLRQVGKVFVAQDNQLMMVGLVQDISVQKSLEKKILELTETVAMTSAVAEMSEEAATITSFTWLPDGYMQWSDGFYRFLGYKPGSIEPLARLLYRNIHQEDLKTFKDAEALLLNHQAHDDIYVRFLSRGGIKQTKITFRRIDAEKEFVTALLQDVTKQKEAESLFAQTRQYAELVTDSVTDMILFTNLDHTVVYWNKVAEEMTGISKDDALQSNLFDVLPRLRESDFLTHLHLAVQGAEFHASRVNNCYLRNSQDYWLWPMKNETGEVMGVLHVVHDISRQLELQQQLSERLNFIESLVEASVDRIVVLDRFMNYLYWNKKAEEYYAIRKDRVIGKNILEIFPAFRNDPSYQHFRTVLKGETVYLAPLVGEEVKDYSETYLVPVKNEEGDVAAVLWIVHDLSKEYEAQTEKRRAEDKIREQAHYLERITETTPDMISITELGTRKLTFLNADTFRMHGFDPDEMVRLSNEDYAAIIHPEDKSVLNDYFERFSSASDDTIIIAEYRAKNKANDWIWFMVRGRVFERDQEGKATHVLNLIENITARKKADTEILRLKDEVAQRATDKYKALFDSTDEGFSIQEVVTDENGCVTDVIYREANGAFEHHTGMKDVLGRKVSEFVPHIEQSFLDALTQVYKTGKPLRSEGYAADLDRWFTYHYSRIGGAGSPLIAAVFNDITERKQREQHQEFLLKFSDALRSQTRADAVANKAIEMLFHHLQVDRCYISEVFVNEGYSTVGPESLRPGALPMAGVYQLSDYPETMRQLMTEPVVVHDSDNDPRFSDSEKAMLALVPQRALLVAPLRKGPNQVIWALVVAMATPRNWTEAERLLLEDLAERTWAAIERAKAEEALRLFSKSLEQQVEERVNELKHNKDLLQSVFDASLQGIILFQVVHNADGSIQDYRVVLNNKTTEKWNGRDLVGTLYSREFPAIKQHGILDAFNRVMETGEPAKLEVKYEGEGFKNWFVITALKVGDEELLSTAEDITERKNAEEQVRENLAILQQAEDMAQAGSWEYEIATGNFSWSEGMFRLFGRPPQLKVTPETFLDLVVEEDRRIAKEIVSNLRKRPAEFEKFIKIRRNEEVRLIRVKASLVYSLNGSPEKLIGVALDMSDIQKAEDDLKESRRWLEETAKASPDSITVYDLQKKQPVYLNSCLAEWIGTTNEDLVQMGIEGRMRLVHPDDRLKLLQYNDKVAAAKESDITTFEYRVITRENKTVWLRNRSRPFQRDASGRVTHLLSTLQNVTGEVELQEELKQHTRLAETILENSTNRITVFDRNYRFLAWNRRCEQIHKRKKEDVVGKTIFEIFPGVEKHPVFMDAQRRSVDGEYVYVPFVQDGFTGAFLELFYVPLKNEAGETYAVLNIMHDVTSYVANAEQMDILNKQLEAKNSQLEQKNEEITSFAFVASHDMKEPLRKIQTFSDWLVHEESQHLSEKGRTMIEKINGSVHRMEILLEDILVLTKIHSDTHKEEEVNLDNVFTRVMNEMSDLVSSTQTVVHKGKLPIIKGNRNQLYYLFKNLVSNAIKFHHPGCIPELTITSEIVNGDEFAGGDRSEEYVKISFRDNGFGFDQRYAKKIFEVFQRLHGKDEFQGTGIGLAICKKIMENHGGVIRVQSEPEKGSVFTCFFPLH